MVALNTPILNSKKVFKKLKNLLFFYHFSGVTCIYTMQFLVVFDRREMRLQVVLVASWRNKAIQKSSIDGLTSASYWCSCDIYRLLLTVQVF